MPVALITHPACLRHDNGPYHPECPDRLRAMLPGAGARGIRRPAARAGPAGDGRATHARASAATTSRRSSPSGPSRARSCNSTATRRCRPEAPRRRCGRRAARSPRVDAVMEGWARAAFAAMRPPGPSREAGRPMGFCLFDERRRRRAARARALGARAGRRGGFRRAPRQRHPGHFPVRPEPVLRVEPPIPAAIPGPARDRERGVAGNIVNVPLPPGVGQRGVPRGLEAADPAARSTRSRRSC